MSRARGRREERLLGFLHQRGAGRAIPGWGHTEEEEEARKSAGGGGTGGCEMELLCWEEGWDQGTFCSSEPG